MSVRSPTAIELLSFAYPGLGQLVSGARRRGVILALPATAILVLLLVLASLGTHRILELLVTPEVLAALLAVNAVAAVLHVVAIADAYRGAVAAAGVGLGRGARWRARAVLVGLIAATIALHGALGYVGARSGGALDSIFGPGAGWSIPEPSSAPTASPTVAPTTPSLEPRTAASSTGPRLPAPTATPTPTPTPAPTPTPTPVPAWAEDGRLNLLLIGSDAGPDRWLLRTDTLIVLSVEVATGRAALFGIPRNLTGVPLPPESAAAFADGRFPGLLNALYVYAMGHPTHFPGGDARGFRAVSGAVQELIGQRLDGAVVVNLRGFVDLVNALGGLWIDVPARLVDERYPLEDGSGTIRLVIEPGCRHLDGRLALAYARSRHQDSDYGRMRRQQLLLLALRAELDPLVLLPRVPELLSIAETNLWTTLEVDDLPRLVELAARVRADEVAMTVFAPPKYSSHLSTAEWQAIKDVVAAAFAGPAPTTPPPTAPAPACGG